MRRTLLVLLIFALGFEGAMLLIQPEHNLSRPLLLIILGLILLIALDRIFGWFRPNRKSRLPRSLMAEIEQLYFRCMREMLNDAPNVGQVINDLQRILSIDPHYKNAQHYLNRAQTMQARAEGYATPLVRSPNSADFRRLQEQLIDPEPGTRKSVIMELIHYDRAAVDPLIALLMDEDADVRVHAATALGWVGGQEAVEPLLVALQDANHQVRRSAARAICWVVDESAIEGLAAVLRDDDSYVRQYAARALGWSGDRRAIRPLVELLMVEQDSDVREYTFTALNDLGEQNVRVERPLVLES
jgi:hypothetical protein